MDVSNGSFGTASGDSDPQMPAAGSVGTSRVSSSPTPGYPTNAEELRLASAASNGAGNVTVGSAEEQDTTPGPQTGSATEHQAIKDKNSDVGQENVDASYMLSRSIRSLKSSLTTQDRGLRLLFQKAETLEVFAEKTRSPAVKEVIEELLAVVEVLKESREPVVRAFNMTLTNMMALETVNNKKKKEMAEPMQTVPQPEQNALNQDRQEAILKACEELAISLAKQEDINALKSSLPASVPNNDSKARNQLPPQKPKDRTKEPPPPAQQTQDWTKVVRKRGKNKATKKHPPVNKPPSENAIKAKRPPPDSISVKPENGETYSDILKAIRQKVDINAIGSQVSKISESRNGEIIIRLNHKDKKREVLVDALKSNLGDHAAVRSLVSHDDVDIQDLDNITTASEIESCIKSALGLSANDASINVKSIRPAYAGTQRATVRLRSAEAIKLAKMGRISIGWIKARVRLKTTTTRCFRCLGYGHTTHTCKGPDRSKACSLCNSEGHRASACTSLPNCAACTYIGEPTNHYPGSSKCTAHRKALSKNKVPPIELRESGIETGAKIIHRDA